MSIESPEGGPEDVYPSAAAHQHVGDEGMNGSDSIFNAAEDDHIVDGGSAAYDEYDVTILYPDAHDGSDTFDGGDGYRGPEFITDDDELIITVNMDDYPPEAADRTREATDRPEQHRPDHPGRPERARRPVPDELRITCLLEPKEDGAYPNSDRPTPDLVASAARNGRTSRIIYTRGERNGPVVLDVTPDMKPDGAETADVQHPVESEVPDDFDDFVDQPDNVADTTPREEYKSTFTHWARLEEHRRPPAAKNGGEKKAPDEKTDRTFDIGGMLASHPGAFQAIYEGTGVDPETAENLGRKLDRNLHDAGDNKSYVGKVREQRLKAVQEDFVEADESGLMRRTVLIGASSAEELAAITETFAGQVLGSERSEWKVARDPNRGWYGSPEEARAADPGDLESYISPAHFAEDVRYPTRNEVLGIPKDHQYNLGAGNREIPEGAYCATVGDYIDDFGNVHPARVPLDTFLEHTIVPGASGAGKTVTLEKLTKEVITEGWRRHVEDPDIPPVKVVVFSARKSGDITKNVADMLAGEEDLPDHLKKVYVIRPGEGYRPTVSVHGSAARLTEKVLNKMGIQVKRSMQGAKITFSAGNSGDAESTRVNERYFMDGLIMAHTSLGADTINDTTKYPYDVPARPTNRFLAWCTREKLRAGGYEAKVQGNVGEYVAGPLEMHPHTIAGDAFHGGPNVDYEKVLANPALTTEELENMGTDAVSRKIAMMAKMDALEMAVRRELEEKRVGTDAEGNYNVSHLRLLVEFDEAFDLFDESVTGDIMADYLTRLRSIGVGIVIAQQGGFKLMNPRVIKNTQTVVALKTNDPQDLDVLAERLVIERDNATYIARPRLRKGAGLMSGPGLEATRFQTAHPGREVRGEGRFGDVGELLDFDVYEQFFTHEELEQISLAEVEKFVTEDPTGMRISMHAQVNAALVASGRLPQKFGKGRRGPQGQIVVESEIKRGINRLKEQDKDGSKDLLLRAAAVMAAKSAIDGRPDIMYESTRAEASAYHAQHLIAQINGEEPSEELSPPRNLVLNFGEYSIVEDQIVDRLTARPIKLPESLKKFMKGDIPGETAAEQLDILRAKESAAINRVRAAVASGTATQQAANELGNLLNGTRPKRTEAEIQQAADELELLEEIQSQLNYITLTQSGEGVDYVKGVVQQRLGHPMNEAESKVFGELLEMMPESEVGFPTVRAALTKVVKTKYLQAPKVNLTDYEEEIYPGQHFEGETARDQLKAIQAKAAAFLQDSPYRANEADLFFAYDTLQGATAIDRFIATTMSNMGPQGVIFREQDRENSDPGSDKMLFAHLVRIRNTGAQDLWKKVLANQVLYGMEKDRPLGATRYLVGKLMKYTQQLQQRGEESNRNAVARAQSNQGRS